MDELFITKILECTGASAVGSQQIIQELWSGYGKIIRVQLIDSDLRSVIVKHVQAGVARSHPRGWNTDQSHIRKVQSYQVETRWYSEYSSASAARLPQCLGISHTDDEVLIILEDLDLAGFSIRKQSATWGDVAMGLEWLATFHASYLGRKPSGLWKVGTYWHFATRQSEWKEIDDPRLQEAASAIDAMLSQAEYQTFVHGDAKLANFCFSANQGIAGVDFQYVGGGCGMKDVAYFIGSCLREKACERYEEKILDTYFDALERSLGKRHAALEAEWRSLYHVAWADFHRFIKGWSPSHWKINTYSERVTAAVIDRLL